MKKSLPLILSLIALGAASRLIDNGIPNFAPVGAIALFSGAYLTQKRFSWLIPMVVMLLSDLLLQLSGKVGFHTEMPFVYGAFLLTFFIGKKYLQQNIKFGRVLTATVGTSLSFFIITNFGSWILSPIYTKDFAGLLQCYTMAIPFYNPGDYLSSFALNGVFGDLFFTAILFGAYELISKRIPATAASSVSNANL